MEKVMTRGEGGPDAGQGPPRSAADRAERVAEDVAEEFPVEREKELDRWSDRWRRRLKSSRRRRTRAT